MRWTRTGRVPLLKPRHGVSISMLDDLLGISCLKLHHRHSGAARSIYWLAAGSEEPNVASQAPRRMGWDCHVSEVINIYIPNVLQHL